MINQYDVEQIQVIDDITRIMDVKNYWKTNHNTRPNSRPKSRIYIQTENHQQRTQHVINFKLPKVKKIRNIIEFNKSVNKRSKSVKYDSNKKEQSAPNTKNQSFSDDQQLQEDVKNFYELPSHKNTKEKNNQILQQLTKYVTVLRNYPQLKQQNPITRQIEQQIESDEISFLTNIKYQTNPNYQKNLHANENLLKNLYNDGKPPLPINQQNKKMRKDQISQVKLEKQIVDVGGIKYPYDLYMSQTRRRNLMSFIYQTN